MDQNLKSPGELCDARTTWLTISIGTIRELMKERHLVVALVTCLGACSIHSTGVVSSGEDRYKVTHLSGSGSVSTDSLTADAINEATAYCTQNQRGLYVTNSKETPLGPFGQ